MKIISVVFDYENSGSRYSKLAAVLESSVKLNCPDADFELIKLEAPKQGDAKKRCFVSNTVKLWRWLEEMEKAKDDVVFLDADMIVLNDLAEAFQNNDFDVGLCKRTGTGIPYNGGAVFVRNTPAAHEFIKKWAEINQRMFKNFGLHSIWRKTYAGMNQAALGYLLEKESFSATLKDFDCGIWNMCREDWIKVDEEKSKIVHVKSELRRMVFSNIRTNDVPPRCRKATKIWRDYAIKIGINTPDNSMAQFPGPMNWHCPAVGAKTPFRRRRSRRYRRA